DGRRLWEKRDRESVLKANAAYAEALAHSRAAGDKYDQALTLYSMALLYRDLGERDKAVQFATEALPLARASGHRILEGWTLSGLGVVQGRCGDSRTSIEYLEQALTVMRSANNPVGEGAVLDQLGLAYTRIDPRKALEYLDSAVPLLERMNDRRTLATVFND